jgi:hypothetical protein
MVRQDSARSIGESTLWTGLARDFQQTHDGYYGKDSTALGFKNGIDGNTL